MKTLLLAGLLGSSLTLLGWVGGWIDAGAAGTGAGSFGAGGAPEPEPARPSVPALPGAQGPAAPRSNDAAGSPRLGPADARGTAHLLEQLEDVVTRLEALDAKVEVLGDEIRRLGNATPQACTPAPGPGARGHVRETDWLALEILREDHAVDAEALEASVRFLTTHQLLERFGAPTRLDPGEGATRWVYHHAERGLRVTFTLLGDLVTGVRVIAT